jgi:hypothetical protein
MKCQIKGCQGSFQLSESGFREHWQSTHGAGKICSWKDCGQPKALQVGIMPGIYFTRGPTMIICLLNRTLKITSSISMFPSDGCARHVSTPSQARERERFTKGSANVTRLSLGAETARALVEPRLIWRAMSSAARPSRVVGMAFIK